MKRMTLGTLGVVGWTVLSCIGHAADVPTTCLAHSQATIDAWTGGDTAGTGRYFNDKMRAMPAQSLATLWQSLTAQLGELQRRDPGQPRPSDASHQRVDTTLTFARGRLNVRIACDPDGRIAGFHLGPAPAAPAAASTASVNSSAPTSTAPASTSASSLATNERALQVITPLGPLGATLTLPSGPGPFPAVVLVQGSGPHDRDETVEANKPFKDLADGLAADGIATLRYDKRTKVYPEAFMAQGAHVTVDQEVTDDAVTALQLLGHQAQIDPTRRFVLGHSLGAMLAPRIDQQASRQGGSGALAGVILLAAPARPLQQIIVDQMVYLHSLHPAADPHFAAQLLQLRQQAATIDHLDGAHLPAGPLMLDVPASYWLSLQGYDPIAVAHQLSTPILILQGLRDYQVTPADDFSRWQQAFSGNPRVSFISYPTLTHLFMPGSEPPSPADYAKPAHVDGKVVADIAHWVRAQPPAATSSRAASHG